MIEHNENIIYKDQDPKEIIKNNYFNNYFILTKKQNLNRILRLKKNINIIDNSFALIDITGKT